MSQDSSIIKIRQDKGMYFLDSGYEILLKKYMELLGHNFFVFRNAETFEVNVVYKRKDKTYGLIEPEF